MQVPRTMRIVVLVLLLAGLAILVVRLWPRAKLIPELTITWTKPTPTPIIAWSEPNCAEVLDQPGRDLPFASLVHKEGVDPSWSNADFSEQRVYLLCSREDVQQLQGLVREYELETVASVDFEHHAVLAVFDGIKGNLCPGIAIERVRQVGTALVVCARHWGRPPNQECEAAMKNPCDFVLVPRDEEMFEGVTLMLCARPVPFPTRMPR